MSGVEELEAILADGPEGFLGPRLRAYVLAVNPALREEENAALEQGDEQPVEESGEGEAGGDAAEQVVASFSDGAASDANEEASGDTTAGLPSEEAWRPAAIAYWQGLWSGSWRQVEAIWGVPAPAELRAFEEGVYGADLYSTFHELRLDVWLMYEPPPGKNLFEMLVLNDQLDSLGTGLPEAFAGVACFGQLGDGDTFHLEVAQEREARPRSVLFWSHDEREYSSTFARSLEDTVYLAALCYAADHELISAAVATAGYRKLRGRVAPSWHFAMDERDAGFEAYEHPGDAEVARRMAARAQWIIGFLRSDGATKLDDLKPCFSPEMNPAMTAEMVSQQLGAAQTRVTTALYAMWRAYLFDEPALEQLLAVGRAHPGRLARDAAKLIDELRGGRVRLGKIGDWPSSLGRFRALDLDPRREPERAREKEERRRNEEARRAALVAAMQVLAPSEVEAFCWENLGAMAARPQLWDLLLAEASRAEVRQGIQYLVDKGYAGDGSTSSNELHAATCQYLAERADGAVQALLIGEALWPAPAVASEAGDKEGDEEGDRTGGAAGAEASARRLDSRDAWRVLPPLARAGRLEARALPPLHAALEVTSFDLSTGWRLTRVIEVLGLARDAASVEALGRLLGMMPAEGDFETGMKFDYLIEAVALALQRIGEPAGAAPLLRFAGATSKQMGKARVAAAYAVATLAPASGGVEVLTGMLRLVTEARGSGPNTLALLSYGLIGKAQPEGEQPALLERLRAVTPREAPDVEVQLARAIAVRLLGGECQEDEVAELMLQALREPCWREEETVQRRRRVVAMFDMLPVVEVSAVAPVLRMGNEELTAEARLVLARHGYAEEPSEPAK